jgi:hypothetical protein
MGTGRGLIAAIAVTGATEASGPLAYAAGAVPHKGREWPADSPGDPLNRFVDPRVRDGLMPREQRTEQGGRHTVAAVPILVPTGHPSYALPPSRHDRGARPDTRQMGITSAGSLNGWPTLRRHQH